MTEITRAQIRSVLERLRGGLVVSCRARPGNPLHGASPMAMMAQAAELGGARGVRVDGPAEVAATLGVTTLPVIATYRRKSSDRQVTITPTVASAQALLDAGATIVATDATARRRPNDDSLTDIVAALHAAGAVALGDLATIDDLAHAFAADIDAVGTTLSGHTGHSGGPLPVDPDFALMARLVRDSPVPVYAADRYWTPEQVVRAFDLGASFVIVGAAITNPTAITSRFVHAISTMQAPKE